MIVLCTGMYRSGSTWSFNIAKSVIKIQNKNNSIFSEYNESLQTIFLEHAPKYDNLIIKCHKVDEFGKLLIKHNCAKVIYTYREPLEAITSSMQKFNFTFSLALHNIKESLEFMQFQKRYANVLIISYSEITDRITSSIKKIAQHLDTKLIDDEIESLKIKFSKDNVKSHSDKISELNENTVNIGFSIYEKESLFHKNHIRENRVPWKDFLSEEQIALAVSILKPYVDDSGALNI